MRSSERTPPARDYSAPLVLDDSSLRERIARLVMEERRVERVVYRLSDPINPDEGRRERVAQPQLPAEPVGEISSLPKDTGENPGGVEAQTEVPRTSGDDGTTAFKAPPAPEAREAPAPVRSESRPSGGSGSKGGYSSDTGSTPPASGGLDKSV